MGFSKIMYATLTVREGMATETDLGLSDASETTQGRSSETTAASSIITPTPTPYKTIKMTEAVLPIASSVVISTGRAQGTAVTLMFGVRIAAGLVIGQ